MAGDFVAVKQDDGDVIAIALEKLGVLRNVDHLQGEVDLPPTAFDDFLRPLAKMAIWFGVDGYGVHRQLRSQKLAAPDS